MADYYYGYEFQELLQEMPSHLNSEQQRLVKEALLDDLHVKLMNIDETLLDSEGVKELRKKYPPQKSIGVTGRTVNITVPPIVELGTKLCEEGVIDEDTKTEVFYHIFNQGTFAIARKMAEQAREKGVAPPDEPEPGSPPTPGNIPPKPPRGPRRQR
jgi:hypothetical protein